MSYSLYNRHSKESSFLPSSSDRKDGKDRYDENGSSSCTGKDRNSFGETTFREALKSTALTVSLALCFGVGIYLWMGSESGMEYFAGYIVEQSLSVDNLFVFIMLFDYFKVPLALQNRVLNWGIIGAVVMRGFMIYFGVAAIAKFEWLMLIFAAILLFSAYKLLNSGSDEEEDLQNNAVMKFVSLFISSTVEYDGDRFFMREKGVWLATPLFMCLLCIEMSDVIFAIDSIPAVLGISKDPFIIYSSNIFAIMGLRALYTVIAKAVSDLSYLKPAVALVLGFVGGKMIGDYFAYTVSTFVSLGVVVLFIGGGVVLSFAERIYKPFPLISLGGANDASINIAEP